MEIKSSDLSERRKSQGFSPCRLTSESSIPNDSEETYSMHMTELQSEVSKTISESETNNVESQCKKTVDSTDEQFIRNTKFDSDDENTVDDQWNTCDNTEENEDESKMLDDKYQSLFETLREFLSDLLKHLTKVSNINCSFIQYKIKYNLFCIYTVEPQ